MSRKRKRKSRRTRNPVAHKRRRSSRRRNPTSRRRRSRGRSRMFRNPPVLSDVFTQDNIVTGLGVLTGVAGTRYLVNKLIQGNVTTGVRMFDLPGITYSTAAAPLTQAQFTTTNKLALAFYETAIPAIAGYLLKKYNDPFAKGLMQAAIVNVGIAAIRQTTVGQTAGLMAFLPRQRGMGTYIPGVPPLLSGPGTSFLNQGTPAPRNGMGAVVNQRWHQMTTQGGPNPFAAN